MATASKRAAPPKRRQSSESPSLPPESPARPFLRFYHSEALRTQTLALLDTIEQARDPARHRAALGDLVMELTKSGMDYFFLGPLRVAEAGIVAERAASLGLAGVRRAMGPVIRQMIGRMGDAQLLSVCGSIRQLMT